MLFPIWLLLFFFPCSLFLFFSCYFFIHSSLPILWLFICFHRYCVVITFVSLSWRCQFVQSIIQLKVKYKVIIKKKICFKPRKLPQKEHKSCFQKPVKMYVFLSPSVFLLLLLYFFLVTHTHIIFVFFNYIPKYI